MSSFILIYPTVWTQYTYVTDRQDNGPVAQGKLFYKQSPKNVGMWELGLPPIPILPGWDVSFSGNNNNYSSQ